MAWLSPSGFSRLAGSANPAPIIQRNLDLAKAFFAATGMVDVLGLNSAAVASALQTNFTALATASGVTLLPISSSTQIEVSSQANFERLNTALAAVTINYAATDPGTGNGTWWIDLSTASPHNIKKKTSGVWNVVGTVREPGSVTVTDLQSSLPSIAPNTFLAGPSAGATPATAVPRAIVAADLPASGVAAASYGSSSQVPVFTVGTDGRITSASTAAVAGAVVGDPIASYLRSI